LSQALSEGAKLIYGGKDITINGLEEGYYLEPTILECHDDLTISSEEIFGPVLQLYKFKTEDEVLARANNSNLGLAAGIFTNDFHRIDKFTELFEVDKDKKLTIQQLRIIFNRKH
jgi:betaine-aldehyde dehydrogenase